MITPKWRNREEYIQVPGQDELEAISPTGSRMCSVALSMLMSCLPDSAMANRQNCRDHVPPYGGTVIWGPGVPKPAYPHPRTHGRHPSTLGR